jgi:hypothetical protein
MKRLKKAIMIPIRNTAYRWNRLKLAYWAEQELFELRNVQIMPTFYYRWLFNFSMRIVHIDKFQRFADKIIHTIPYHVRFKLA